MRYIRRCISRWCISGCCVEIPFAVTTRIQCFNIVYICISVHALGMHIVYISLWMFSQLIDIIDVTLLLSLCLTYISCPEKKTYLPHEPLFGTREKEKHATLLSSWNMLVNFNDLIEVAATVHSPRVSLHFCSHFIPFSSSCISPLYSFVHAKVGVLESPCKKI